MTGDDLVAKGKQLAESGKYTRPRGLLLGRIQAWGLDVYEGSPQQWKDALRQEQESQ